MHECINYQQLDEDKVQCQTCAHFCTISSGQVGTCGVRQNKKGKLYLLNYGKSPAVNIDPIEKKPLFHFQPGSYALSVGTYGCNFRCGNCQNFSLSQIQGLKGKVKEYGYLNWGQELTPEELVDKALETDCQSIAYTYNEPTIFLEYALDTMKLAHQQGLKNVWVSNGFMSLKSLEKIIPYLDAINIDIKSFENDFYQENCGARIKPVLENCKKLAESDVWLEVTTLIIPTKTDDMEMLRDLARFIKNHLGKDVPWHISAFSASISWKMKDLPNTSPAEIHDIYELGKKVGLNYIYAGNIGGEKQNTYCPECNELVIRRVGYQIDKADSLPKCQNCSHPIPGIFST